MEAVHPIPESAEASALSKPIIPVSPWIVLAVLLLGEFMILLDTTILEVAIPSLLSDLHASLDSVLWVLNAYILTFAILLITAGRLGDIFGPKKLYLAGLAIFGAASAACGLAHDPGQLIAFRVVQAIGGAVLTPQPASIITCIFPPEKRGSAFGVMGAVMGLAAVAGPTLGGFLTTWYSWRAIFYPNVPVALVTFILAVLMIPEVTIDRRRRLDVGGVLLSTSGLVLCMYALIEGQRYAWGRILGIGAFDIGPLRLGLVSIPTLMVLGILVLIAFVLWETRQEEPLLPLSLFRDRNFSIANVVVAALSFGMVGLMFTLILFLQSVLEFSALEAGIAIIPNALLVIVAAPIAGKLGARMEDKYLLAFGLLLYSAGILALILLASLHATGLTFTPALVATGIGLGFTVAPVVTLAMMHVAPSAAGAASGFMNSSRQVGAALGTAVVGAVLQSRLGSELPSQASTYADRLPAEYRRAFVDSYRHASSNGLNIGKGETGGTLPTNLPTDVARQFDSLSQLVFDHAYLNAVRPSWAVIIAVVVPTAFATMLMRKQRVAETAPRAVEPDGFPMVRSAPSTPTPIPGKETIMVPVKLPQPISGATLIRPARTAYLARMGGGEYAEYPVEGVISVGRAPSSGIVLSDSRVSRRHAELYVLDGHTILRDLNSRNGTFINGTPVHGKRQLHAGDEIAIGGSSFVFRDDMQATRPRMRRLGPGEPHEYSIRGHLTLGRAPANDIVIDDPLVSRRHAEIHVRGNEIVLRDLESLNGTRINGDLVSVNQPLREGDLIVVGSALFTYQSDAEEEAQPG